ncbi:unnamed protein product [Ixodes persulcatus]
MSAERNVDASRRYEQVPAAEGPLEEREVDSEYLCGLGNYRPCWMQKFATSRYFALVFGVLGIFQGALRTYLVGTLSTVEKRFSMSGRLSSIVMIADNISPILATLVLAVWLRRTSKPNWVAGGMLLSVLGAVSCCLPYGIHGKGTHLLGDTGQPGNALRTQFCGDANVDVLCEDGTGDGVSLGPLIFLFVGNFLNGLGGTAYYVIGTTYMDDNVKKKNSALYFGSVFAFRLMGPVVGFFLSSFCLSYPEDPHGENNSYAENAEMDQDDPRWIGAWWMGYLIIGTGIFLSTLPMFFFPKKIRPKAEANKIDTTETKGKSIKDDAKETWQVLLRLSKNPIYVLKTTSTITAVFGLAGYYISFPKYTEHQFSQTASQASLIAGPTYIVSNVIGTILGSVFVHKVKPRPRIVAIHGLVVTLISIVGILALMAVSCGSIQYPVIRDNKERLTIENSCSIDCDCSTSIHHPVCDMDTGTQYFSACFAGCKPEPFNNTEYRDCVCLQSEPGMNKFSRGHVKNAKCEQDCMGAMMAFAGVLFFIQVALSSANVGSTLLLLRAVDPKDKSIALTTNAFFLNILAFIPYPLIHGAVIDASCIVWEDRCGESGACWIYDLQKLRYLIHGVTTLVLVLSCLFQAAVIYYSKTIRNFYDEDETEPPATRAGGESLRGTLEIREPDPRKPKSRLNSSDSSWEFRNLHEAGDGDGALPT